MIQASDLRIGNLVKYCASFVEITSVPKIKSEIIYFNFGSTDNYCAYFKEISPIPITEKWLLKFGFYKEHYEDDFTKYCIVFEDIKFEFYIYYNGNKKICFGKLTIMFKYVHQLQNLYFALTGKELTYSDVI